MRECLNFPVLMMLKPRSIFSEDIGQRWTRSKYLQSGDISVSQLWLFFVRGKNVKFSFRAASSDDYGDILPIPRKNVIIYCANVYHYGTSKNHEEPCEIRDPNAHFLCAKRFTEFGLTRGRENSEG